LNISDAIPDEIRSELDRLNSWLLTERHQSLVELLKAWSRYADLLSSRAPIHLDDYQGILFARDAVENILTLGTPNTADLLHVIVRQSDYKFYSATKADESRLLEEIGSAERCGWWRSRIPQDW
jgi:hypothetical protein